MKKYWRKLLAASLIVGSLFSSSTADAEVKMYTAMGVDYGNELESQDIVKLRARDKAIKNAVKQAGVYLKTYSRSVNSELNDDEVLTITSNTYELVGEVKYNRVAKQVTDQVILIMWEATVNVNVDDTEVAKWAKRDSKEKSALISQTRETQKLSAENDKKVEDLRKRADKVTGEAERAKLTTEFAQTDKEFLYNQKIEEGDKLRYRQHFAEALNSFSEAIKINPNVALAYQRRAFIYYAILGKHDAAIADANKAIQLEPANVNCYETRAYIYNNLKCYDKALADANKMVEINPKAHQGYHLRAEIYKSLNQPDKALADYTNAINADPQDAFEYYCRADLYKELGQYDKALADYTNAIKFSSPKQTLGRTWYYKYRAELYGKLKQYDKALADFTECINLETDYANKAKAYADRASFCEFTLKQPDKAKADYEAAVELYTRAISSSTNAEELSKCYRHRALLYKYLDQYDKAIVDFNKTIELNSHDSLAYYFRADLYKKLRRYNEAIADYTKFIELAGGQNSLLKWAYKYRSECYEALGEMEKAQADKKKYEELKG